MILKIARTVFFVLLILNTLIGVCQNNTITGTILDSEGLPVAQALVVILPDSISTLTSDLGQFTLKKTLKTETLTVTHVRFERIALNVRNTNVVAIKMHEKTTILEGVQIKDQALNAGDNFNLIKLDPKNTYTIPSGTGDFSRVLATLPGVVTNSELSTTYSVRGGNYDENLVYVNGIKIYRPQIIRAGQQEGLSFINPDMVKNVQFSAGGWRAAHGDVLSSVLNVTYKEPKETTATINASLLGGAVHFGGADKSRDFTYSMSIRHKTTKYLLNTLETKGQYLPKFTDYQMYLSKRLSEKTQIGFLAVSANNHYLTVPTTRETEFGNFQESLRFNVHFEGREKLDYSTNQAAITIKHAFNENFITSLITSGVLSREKENYEVNGTYLLCNVNKNTSSEEFNKCVLELGAGSNFNFGRNLLTAEILSTELKNQVYIGSDLLEFGMSWDMESIEDRLKEFSYVDSAEFIHVINTVNNHVDIMSHKIAGFAQYTLSSSDSSHVINAGVRFNYWTYSHQPLVSPRIQYAYRFGYKNRSTLRLASGIYQQHPFYRELRDRQGNINPNIKAQSSFHLVAGWDKSVSIWGRPFKITSDAYYKYLWSVNPYDVENVRIRYHATNTATAYMYGADFRINGEFIEGTESWFSLGLLSAQENLGNGYGYVRRPTDQHITLGVFFQDHLPNDPSVKVNLSAIFGSGLPFGPPGNDELRNSFAGNIYKRVDIGFSKTYDFQNDKMYMPNNLWIGVEVLNLLGVENIISYTWIQDYASNQYAIPNGLSARFFNMRIITRF